MEKSTTRILVVDDENRVTRLLSLVLQSAGYEVLATEQGEKAAEWLREREAPIDLMITDLRMDPIDGFEMLRIARQERPALPVVLLTAHSSDEVRRKAAELGAFDLIPKPFAMADLLSLVRRALATSSSPDGKPGATART